MILIDFVEAREILDSRGFPTVEAKVVLNNGLTAIASVPAGASKSTFEAIELRDTDAARYSGQGVLHAVKNINEIISPRLKKMNPLEQSNIDKVLIELDQTPNKAHLGANATLAVSEAVARAGAMVSEKPLWAHLNEVFNKQRAKNVYGEEAAVLVEQRNPRLPTPLFNVINGGKHAASSLDFQEFIVIPPQKLTPAEHIRIGAEIRHNIERVLQQQKTFFGVGDEGGVSAQFESVDQVFDVLSAAIKQSGRALQNDITLAIDVAADSIDHFNPAASVELYKQLSDTYPLTMIEDPLPSRDYTPWAHLRALIHSKVLLAGDDLIATNAERLRQAITAKALDMVIIKPNQVGTVSETLETAKVAKHHTVGMIVSHRSGETNDSFIADLAVAVGADYLKAGSPVRGERTAKYNRLLEIYNENNWSLK